MLKQFFDKIVQAYLDKLRNESGLRTRIEDSRPARRDVGGGRPDIELFMISFTQFLTTEHNCNCYRIICPCLGNLTITLGPPPDLLASTPQVKYTWQESIYIRLYRDQPPCSRPGFRHPSKYPASKLNSCECEATRLPCEARRPICEVDPYRHSINPDKSAFLSFHAVRSFLSFMRSPAARFSLHHPQSKYSIGSGREQP